MVRLELEENYICQHFGNIYKQICSGTKGQAEWRKYTKANGDQYRYKWNVAASKSSVLECIRCFFHLCLNAGKVGDEYKKIEQWTRDLMIISCMPVESSITDSYKYSKLVEASDPITNFLFGCFDWNIIKINEDSKKTLKEPYLNGFDSRIKYYKDCAKLADELIYHNDCRHTAGLLYSIKIPRNNETHKAAEEFYAHRQKCIERLVYSLYDYITIFYMITNVCKENNSPIKLLDEVCKKTNMPDSFLTTNIIVECVDENNGKPIFGREADVRLYCVDDCGNRIAVSAETNTPGKFRVTFFNKYIICIVTDGKESEPSEKIVINHDFIDGITVKVNIPPQSKTPMPEKISIRELVLNNKDLPADANWILDSIKGYAGDCEFAELARLLTIAAVTKNKNNAEAFENALSQLRKNIEQKIKGGMAGNFSDYLQVEMQKFQECMAKPYQGKEDFVQLCKSIDNLYSCFDYSEYDPQMPHIDQIGENARELVSGGRFTCATTATDESIRQQQRLSHLEFFLKMKDRYPEIVEAEEASLYERIERIYVDQTNFYMGFTIPLRKNVGKLYEYLKNNLDLHQPDKKSVFEYAKLIYNFLNDTPDNIIRIVKLCSETILFWIDQCGSVDKTACLLMKQCKEEIKQLRDNNNLLMPMIYVEDNEKQNIEHVYNIISRCVNILKKRFEKFNYPMETEILSEVRFKSLEKLVSSCSPKSFMQLVCCSLNVKSEIEWLFTCRSLGLSYIGIVDCSAYNKWEQINEVLLNRCSKEINILWKLFSKHERRRQGDTRWSTTVEINNAEASLIVKHLKQQILKIYGNNIPQFISDIMNADDHILPCHAKAMLLREVAVSRSSEVECLLYLIDGVLRYWGYSSLGARGLLGKYIHGDYSKLIVSTEALGEFGQLPKASQQLYLEILMERTHHNIACLLPCVRYMMACRLNFANGGNGNEIIEQSDFFLRMSLMPERDIEPYNYKEFVDLTNVVSLVMQFSNKHPDDDRLKVCSEYQIRWFYNCCQSYYFKHLKRCSIEKGKWGGAIPYKINMLWCGKDFNKKSLHEQMVNRYLNLYRFGSREERTSEWYELEKELFDKVVSHMKEMSPDYQQETSRSLMYSLLYKMDCHDMQAERYIALKPFCRQENFEKVVNEFHLYCKNKLKIGNSSVLDGLNMVRTFFELYGQNIKVPFDGRPTDFVDILIDIYKLFDSLKNAVDCLHH